MEQQHEHLSIPSVPISTHVPLEFAIQLIEYMKKGLLFIGFEQLDLHFVTKYFSPFYPLIYVVLDSVSKLILRLGKSICFTCYHQHKIDIHLSEYIHILLTAEAPVSTKSGHFDVEILDKQEDFLYSYAVNNAASVLSVEYSSAIWSHCIHDTYDCRILT